VREAQIRALGSAIISIVASTNGGFGLIGNPFWANWIEQWVLEIRLLFTLYFLSLPNRIRFE
jgi:hypothetical protein